MTNKNFSFSESLVFDTGANSTYSSPYDYPTPYIPGAALEPVSESSTIAPDGKARYRPVLTAEQYQELYRTFCSYLQHLHKGSGREVRRQPRVGRRELDLYQLYKFVYLRGGYNGISQWKDLGADLYLPETVTNSGYILRTKYEQFILPFEAQLRSRFPVDRPEIELLGPPAHHDENWMVAYGNYGQYGNQSKYGQLSFSAGNISYYNHIPAAVRGQKLYSYDSSQIRVFCLKNYPFTTETFEDIISRHPYMQDLELGTLKDLTRAPSASCFPPYLKRLVLYDVPYSIATELLDNLRHLKLVEMNIQIYSPYSTEPKHHENRIEKYSFAQSSLD